MRKKLSLWEHNESKIVIIKRGFVCILTYMTVKQDLKAVIKMSAEPVSICFQYNLHPIFTYSRRFLFSDSMNKLMTEFTYVISIASDASLLVSDHNITLWRLETGDRGWVMSSVDQRRAWETLDVRQQWFTEGMGGDLVGEVHTCRQYNKNPTRLQRVHSHWSCTPWTLFMRRTVHCVSKKSNWLDRICDNAQGGQKVGCYVHELSERLHQTRLGQNLNDMIW